MSEIEEINIPLGTVVRTVLVVLPSIVTAAVFYADSIQTKNDVTKLDARLTSSETKVTQVQTEFSGMKEKLSAVKETTDRIENRLEKLIIKETN